MKKSKGRPIKEYPYRPHEIISDISDERLILFGAVSLAWNDLEGALDSTIGAGLDMPEPMWIEITSRINGFDGKCALLKQTARILHNIPEKHITCIADTLGAAEEHKKYRDAIIHAKILDPDADTAPTAERKGSVGEVIVTEKALRGLYERICWIRAEIESILSLFTVLHQLHEANTEDEKRSAEQRLKACIPQLQDRQSHRKALPPLPRFSGQRPIPPETEEPQAPPG